MANLSDIHVDDMAEMMSYLEPCPPLIKALDRWGSKYENQRDHMIAWFISQPTKGGKKYSRKKGNTSSRVTYNKLLNPGMLLWLAETLGEDEGTIRAAVDAAIDAEKQNYRMRCNAFREVIGFDRILELLGCPEKWLINPKAKPFIQFDVDGSPHVRPEEQEMFLDAIDIKI